MNIEMKKQKNDKKMMIYILLSLLLAMIIIAGIIIFFTQREKQIIEHEDYIKQCAKEYLVSKYGELDFKLELVEKKFKDHEIWFDTRMKCGHEKDTLEYIFSVSLDGIEDQSFTTVWENKSTGNIEINEIDGRRLQDEDTSFKSLIEKNKRETILYNNIK